MRPLDSTNREITGSLRRQQYERARRQRLLRPIRAIDAVIADLEELHLADRKRVPESFQPRLAELAEILPGGSELELRSRITIVHLMDRLYDIQEGLLREKAAGDGELTEAI